MSVLFELLLVISSIALSVVLSRLAVGEMFRLARITHLQPPPTPDDVPR